MCPLQIFAAENITGTIYNPEGKPLQGIIVRLYMNGKMCSYTSSQKDGTFNVKTDSLYRPATLVFISRLYAKLEYPIEHCGNQGNITLRPEEYTLEEVTVHVPRVRMHGDTITYDVASYTDKGDRNIEDVIKKLPGVRVEENGTITYDGETISNFYIEGLDLMGSNYAIATSSIRPEDISSISVYERHQPKKILKNVKESKKAALNLKLKKNKLLKPIGYITGEAGVGEGMLWAGELYGMFIAPNSQTIISTKGNNNGNTYYYPRQGNNDLSGLFNQTPFGAPSISTDRYMANKSAHFTANTLLRPKENLTFTINTSYTLEHDNYNGYSSTEYLATGKDSNIIFSEKTDNSLRNHLVYANAKAERNIDNFFFSDQLYFNGRFCGNTYGIQSNHKSAQELNTDNYTFSNNLTTIIKHNRKVYEIASQTVFNNSPLNRMSATDMSSGKTLAIQNVSARSFFNKETTSFSWIISSKHSCGVKVAFEANANKFFSDGYADGTSHENNSLSGYSIVTTGEPFYKLKLTGFVWETSFPVKLWNQKYHDLISKKANRSDKVLFDLNSSILYKINPFQHSDISFGWNHEMGDITDFIVNPIYTTYRNISVPGNGEFNEGLNKYIRASYFFRNPMEAFYLNAMISYSHKRNNRISVYDADPEGTATSTISNKSHTSITNVTFTATKDFRKLHTSISINGSGIFMGRESRRSDITLNVKNNIYILTAKIESLQFNELLKMTANVSYSYNVQTFGNILPKTSLNELTLNGSMSFFPTEKFEIYARANYNRSKIAEQSYKGNLFIDAGMLFSFSKFNIEVTARNLSNTSQYAYTIYRTLDVITQSYRLRPIEAMLSIRYNF